MAGDIGWYGCVAGGLGCMYLLNLSTAWEVTVSAGNV
jgi:hypothetical protein